MVLRFLIQIITSIKTYLVILLLSRKLGDPCLRGIDGDLDLELAELLELDIELDLLRLDPDLDLDLDPDGLRL